MAHVIAGLGAQLGLDTTEFKKGIYEAKSALKELKEYLPEALSIAGFIEATRAAMEFSNKIVETAKANDVATASVLELSHALEENGGSAENTSKIYSGFTAKLEAAMQGNARAQESFYRLGVTLNDLGHLSEQDLFEKTINGLSKMKDSAERNGLAFETLGKGIRGVDLKGLAHTLEESKGEFDKYSQAIEQAHELSLKLDKASRDMSLSFTNAVIPSLIKLYDELKRGNGVADLFFNGLRIAMETIAVLGGRVVNTFKAIGMEIEHTFENAKILFTQGIQAAIEDNKRYEKEVQDMAKRIADYEESILHPKVDETKKEDKKEEIARTVIASYAKQLLAARDLSKVYDDQATLAYKELQQKMQGTEETKKQKEVQDAVNKVLNERDKVIDSINKKIAETDPTARGGKELIAMYKKQQQEIMLTAEMQAKMTKELVQDTQVAQETFGFGWTHAYNQFKENAQTAADAGKQSFELVMGSMTSALENFAKTGKLNFADLVKNIVLGLIQIQVQMQAMKAFGMFSNFLGFSSMFTSGTPAPVEQGVFTPVTKSAEGGDLSSGQASIVGENGPEIIVPRGASTVIPNHLTGSVGGTNQTINNYNIQAIDTKSFEDRIYGSAGAVWAANQYATKNIATTRSRT
jgi:lambda family phage tail tape measure protein